jgi:hypothetical protein
MKWAWWAMVVAACGQPSAYHCTASAECVEHGAQGTCELQGYCAFPDATCPSGQRFEQNAGGGLAGTCATGMQPDGGPPPDARSDGKQPDAPSDGKGPAIAFVQTAASKNSGGSSVMITFTNPVVAHDTLIVCTDVATPGSATVTDSLGNTFTAVVGPISDFSTRFYIFAAFDVAGGNDTVSIVVTVAANTAFEGYIHEYAGLVGVDTGGGQDGSATGADAMTSGTIQTHFGNELIFGFGTTGTATVGTGFMQRSSFDSNITEDKVVTAPGLYAATATMAAGAQWTMLMGAFRGY